MELLVLHIEDIILYRFPVSYTHLVGNVLQHQVTLTTTTLYNGVDMKDRALKYIVSELWNPLVNAPVSYTHLVSSALLRAACRLPGRGILRPVMTERFYHDSTISLPVQVFSRKAVYKRQV